MPEAWKKSEEKIENGWESEYRIKDAGESEYRIKDGEFTFLLF